MAITREKKEEILGKVSDIIKNAGSVVFVNFHGLSVTDANTLRKEMKAQDIGYTVAKKTLVKRVLNALKVPGETPAFEGELALAYGNDLVAPAREVYQFGKDHENKLTIVGGIFEGVFADKEKMNTIASIPPLEVLYGQVVNLINSPIQGLVMALNGIAEKKV